MAIWISNLEKFRYTVGKTEKGTAVRFYIALGFAVVGALLAYVGLRDRPLSKRWVGQFLLVFAMAFVAAAFAILFGWIP